MLTMAITDLDPWYLQHLVCPVSRSRLQFAGGALRSPEGRTYPVVDGVPIMLVRESEETLHVAGATLARAQSEPQAASDELYLETLGISDQQRQEVREAARSGRARIDPVVASLVAATGGNAYRGLVGKLSEYPIPEIRLPHGEGRSLLDIGCNWGRWSISAARKGYQVVGLDPSLGAIIAARRVAGKLGLPNRYVVGDARFLPFAPEAFDVVFSYSVLQHFRKTDVATAVAEIARVVKPGGRALIQMPNAFGIVSLIHQARRGFREGTKFDVRYWRLRELERAFAKIGPTSISVDCFFGLGLQKSDAAILSPPVRALIALSELLRAASDRVRALRLVADSVYVSATRAPA